MSIEYLQIAFKQSLLINRLSSSLCSEEIGTIGGCNLYDMYKQCIKCNKSYCMQGGGQFDDGPRKGHIRWKWAVLKQNLQTVMGGVKQEYLERIQSSNKVGTSNPYEMISETSKKEKQDKQSLESP